MRSRHTRERAFSLPPIWAPEESSTLLASGERREETNGVEVSRASVFPEMPEAFVVEDSLSSWLEGEKSGAHSFLPSPSDKATSVSSLFFGALSQLAERSCIFQLVRADSPQWTPRLRKTPLPNARNLGAKETAEREQRLSPLGRMASMLASVSLELESSSRGF